MDPPHFLAIVGPTASGKTGLSLRLGRELGGEVISMDSRQVYRGMDIGTGKVNFQDRARLRHHGLDLRDPDQRYSAGQFSRDARVWIRDIGSRGRVPMLVGGTGFFLKALTHPMFREPDLDRERLERLRGFLNGLPAPELAAFVETLDPEGEVAREGGRHRLTRSVEMALLTGRPLSWWHREAEADHEPLRGLVILLDPPREALYHGINRRVEAMIREGLVEEVETLSRAGFGPEDPGMTGAGYREMLRLLAGETDLETATAEVQASHRRYARRQVTWFRHQLPPGTVVLDPLGGEDWVAGRVVSAWQNARERAGS